MSSNCEVILEAGWEPHFIEEYKTRVERGEIPLHLLCGDEVDEARPTQDPTAHPDQDRETAYFHGTFAQCGSEQNPSCVRTIYRTPEAHAASRSTTRTPSGSSNSMHRRPSFTTIWMLFL